MHRANESRFSTAWKIKNKEKNKIHRRIVNSFFTIICCVFYAVYNKINKHCNPFHLSHTPLLNTQQIIVKKKIYDSPMNFILSYFLFYRLLKNVTHWPDAFTPCYSPGSWIRSILLFHPKRIPPGVWELILSTSQENSME